MRPVSFELLEKGEIVSIRPKYFSKFTSEEPSLSSCLDERGFPSNKVSAVEY